VTPSSADQVTGLRGVALDGHCGEELNKRNCENDVAAVGGHRQANECTSDQGRYQDGPAEIAPVVVGQVHRSRDEKRGPNQPSDDGALRIVQAAVIVDDGADERTTEPPVPRPAIPASKSVSAAVDLVWPITIVSARSTTEPVSR
jgi:hypothetical protein